MNKIKFAINVNETEYQMPSDWRCIGGKEKAEHIISLCNHAQIKPKNLLEVGAGDGAILRYLGEANFCPSMHALEISKSGCNVILSQKITHLDSCLIFDGYQLPFKNKSFDLVVISHVLEHVEYERAILREIARVSKYQIIEIPLDFGALNGEMFHFLGPSYGHINAHSPGSLRFLLATENFFVLQEKLDIYSYELMEYDNFVNNQHEKTPASTLSFKMNYNNQLKKFKEATLNERELMASFYAVLTYQENTNEKNMRALKIIKDLICNENSHPADLIFNYFFKSDDVRLEAALSLAIFCIENKQKNIGLKYLDYAMVIAPNNQEVIKVKNILEKNTDKQSLCFLPIESKKNNLIHVLVTLISKKIMKK